jgi:hypothetical protein
MMTLNGVEQRSFERAVAELIETEALDAARRSRSRTNGYLVDGEYGRLLAGFLRVFPRDQLEVVFSTELAGEAASTLSRVFEFIGVDPRHVPPNLGRRYREAAVRARIPGLNLVNWQHALGRLAPARAVWHLLPEHPRRAIDRAYNVANHRVELWNAHRGESPEEVSEVVQRQLVALYRGDGEALAELIGREPPWLADWAGG